MKGISSASLYLKRKHNKDKLINESVDNLIINFFEDVSTGKVRAKSVEDLSKLLNISLMLKSLANENEGSNQDLILDSLGLTEDDSLKELYNRMLNHMNTTNDETNRPENDL